MQALWHPLSQWPFVVTRPIIGFSASGESCPEPKNVRVVQVTAFCHRSSRYISIPKERLCQGSRGMAWMCWSVLGAYWVVIVPLDSSPDLNYGLCQLVRWHPVCQELASKKIPTRWHRWLTDISRKEARCNLLVVVFITCIIAVSGRLRNGYGYCRMKCCKNIDL